MALIEIRNAAKVYRSQQLAVTALRDITLDIQAAELVALVGKSGCGKSTLLNLCGAVDFPTSGEVRIEGVNTTSLDDAALTRLRREKIGFVFQSFQLLHTMSVVENVELPLLLARVGNARERAMERLQWVDIAEYANRLPHQLSGGQQQRVAIARALVHNPRIVLADEPTGNLDTVTGAVVLELLQRIVRESWDDGDHGDTQFRECGAGGSRDHSQRWRAGDNAGYAMSSLLCLFHRFIFRPLWREPGRTGLTIFAVALGVAVVVAMDLAGQSAAGGFQESVESLAGNADAEITMTGGIEESYLGKLVQLPYAFEFSPRIQDFAFLPHKGEAIPFLGLDLIGDPGMREVRSQHPVSDAFDARAPIWVGSRLGWKRGQRVRLILNDHAYEFTVAGILHARKNQLSDENVIVADIGLAQIVTGKAGRIDAITVRLPAGWNLAQAQPVLRRVLPGPAAIEARGARREQNRNMLAAFRWNLRILSYIALLVGGFLIYNTISISVVRRRADIGIVRAIGMTRGTVMVAFLGEALFLGMVGSSIGIGLGRVMANAAVALVNGTVQALYVTSQPGAIGLSAEASISGIGLGLLVSLVAALGPAIEASRVAPVEAMARGRVEYVGPDALENYAAHRGRVRGAGGLAFSTAAGSPATRLRLFCRAVSDCGHGSRYARLCCACREMGGADRGPADAGGGAAGGKNARAPRSAERRCLWPR